MDTSTHWHAPAANGRSRGRKKSRDITWFNPPYNAAVVTDVGKQFLKLIDKHFTKKHPLGRLLNRNTVKISYSCTKNMKSIISSHNAKLLNSNEQEPTREGKMCNCQRRNKHKCPLDNDCKNQTDVIYHAKVLDGNEQKEYVGSSVNFKKRWYGHTESFRNAAQNNPVHTYLGAEIEPRAKNKVVNYRQGIVLQEGKQIV